MQRPIKNALPIRTVAPDFEPLKQCHQAGLSSTTLIGKDLMIPIAPTAGNLLNECSALVVYDKSS